MFSEDNRNMLSEEQWKEISILRCAEKRSVYRRMCLLRCDAYSMCLLCVPSVPTGTHCMVSMCYSMCLLCHVPCLPTRDVLQRVCACFVTCPFCTDGHHSLVYEYCYCCCYFRCISGVSFWKQAASSLKDGADPDGSVVEVSKLVTNGNNILLTSALPHTCYNRYTTCLFFMER